MIAVASAIIFTACSDDDDPVPSPSTSTATGDGLFVICQGSWGYGNGSISYYDPATSEVENEVFKRANGMNLGDVAQSMTIHGNTGWVVVNNSGVVLEIDLTTYKEKGRIENLISPRNIFFVSDTKAYITHLYDDQITVVDPTSYEVTGTIEAPGMDASTGSTEQMVMTGGYVYCNCWSYQKSILKIDPQTDRVVDQLEVGIQPCSIVLDNKGYIWTLCDGGAWEQNPVGYVAPTLCRIDPSTFKVDKVFTFKLGDSVSSLVTDGDGSHLYWINGGVMSMSVDATTSPATALIPSNGAYYYALTVSPASGEIYVADAIDYVQNGAIYRYSPAGVEKESFTVGVIPGGFCWK